MRCREDPERDGKLSARTLLAVNSGSSSLKASLFLADGRRHNFCYGHIGHERERQAVAFDALFADIGDVPIEAVGHRFVHGGDAAQPARRVDAEERARLESLAHYTPLHMPNNLLGVELCGARFKVPQLACFDTSFHRTMPEAARRLPLPLELGLERYGFHGINYAYVAGILPALLGDTAKKRVLVAHLGSGASLCLLEDMRSLDTTMGLTPIGGIPMGTRSGDLDPGVVLELARRFPPEALTRLFYFGTGLLALSRGLSSDMATLLASDSPDARFAVDAFCSGVRGAIGALAAKAGGVDALVFTGGIGENAPEVRARICAPLGFLGLALDPAANRDNLDRLGAPGSKPILRVAADEESMIARFVADWLEGAR